MTQGAKTPLVIVGAGGFARDVEWLVAEIQRAGGPWELAGFTDLASRKGQKCGRHAILGDDDWLMGQSEIRDVVISIASPKIRSAIYEKLKASGSFRFPNLVHPSVRTDWGLVSMGEGNIVLEGAALSVDIRIGNNNVVSKMVAIGHDVEIGNHCVLNTGSAVSGYVKVGDGCLFGVGSLTRQGISIAPGTVLGMGACAIQDIDEPGTYFGVPARRIAAAGTAQVPPVPIR